MTTTYANISRNTTPFDLEEDGICTDDAVLGAKCIAWTIRAIEIAVSTTCWWLASGFWLSFLAYILATLAMYYVGRTAAKAVDAHITDGQKASVGHALGGFMNRFSRK